MMVFVPVPSTSQPSELPLLLRSILEGPSLQGIIYPGSVTHGPSPTQFSHHEIMLKPENL